MSGYNYNGNSYRVVSVQEDAMTRNVELVNLLTGTKEVCFDDSALVGSNNFEYMIVGNVYNCKIKLFGNIVSEARDNSVHCRIIDRNVVVGNKLMVKVLIQKDEYYIPKYKIESIGDAAEFDFYYTRKDLVQVNDVIHGDMF